MCICKVINNDNGKLDAKSKRIRDALIENKKVFYSDTGGGYTFLEDSEQEVFVPYEDWDGFIETLRAMSFSDSVYYINFTCSEGYLALGDDVANECYSGYLKEISDELESNLKRNVKMYSKCVSKMKKIREILSDREFYEKQYKYQFESYNSFLTEYRRKYVELNNESLMRCSEIGNYSKKLINIEDSSKGILVFEQIA